MPKYSTDFIERVSQATDIVEIIGQYAQLKKQGKNYTACCPFHQEKTPSFFVNPDKQLYHCFGCKAGGNVYKFLMEKENWSFTETVEYLAKRAGIELPNAPSKEQQEREAHLNLLNNINNKATEYFRDNLKKSPKAVNYLESRGIKKELWDRFSLGYAPADWDNLLRHLTALGYKESELIEVGLISKSQKGKSYDRFRDRIIFPIKNVYGRIIGFGGRRLNDDPKSPKYLNSPESELFQKRKNLYFFSDAKKHIREAPLILVEGYMDVIAMAKYGFENISAALGTAFTTEHVKTISQYTKEVILCFDGDEAGENATLKALRVLNNSSLIVKVIRLPKEHDPDTFIQRYGKEAFENLIKNAESKISYLLRRLKKAYDFNNPENILAYLKSALRIIKPLTPIEQDFYVNQLNQETGIDRAAIYSELKSGNNQVVFKPTEKPKTVKKKRTSKSLKQAQNELIKILYYHPSLLKTKYIDETLFYGDFYRWIYKRLKELDQEQPSIELIFKNSENIDYLEKFKELLSQTESEDNLNLNSILSELQKRKRRQKINQITGHIKTTETDSADKMLSQLVSLKKTDWK